VIASGAFNGHKCVNFPIEGIRPLPGVAGSLFGWYGNVIHWGASTHANSSDKPRASIAWVFRRLGAVGDSNFLTKDQVIQMDLLERYRLIVDSLKTFKHWYDIPKSLKRRLKSLKKRLDLQAVAKSS